MIRYEFSIADIKIFEKRCRSAAFKTESLHKYLLQIRAEEIVLIMHLGKTGHKSPHA